MNAATLNNRGEMLRRDGKLADAEACFDEALRLDPNYAPAFNNRALLRLAQERFSDAETDLRAALRLRPDYAKAHRNLGLALLHLQRPDDAEACLQVALRLQPDYAEAFAALGAVRLEQQRPQEAVVCAQEALRRRQPYPHALLLLARALVASGHLSQAEHHFQEALRLGPVTADLHVRLGLVQMQLRRPTLAGQSFAAALQLAPEQPEALVQLYLSRAEACDWSDYQGLRQRALQAVTRSLVDDLPCPLPVTSLARLPLSPAEQLAIARRHAQRIQAWAVRQPPLPGVAEDRNARPRIGYLSADFRDHATGHLIAGLFEKHDRSRWEVFAYSLGPEDGSVHRRRIVAGVEHFVDLFKAANRAIAERIRADGINILVDLMGFAGNGRPEVLALRPAPVQVNWLGFPATMGADFIDYLVADKIIVPPSETEHYQETLVYLPHCYQINDDRQPIAEPIPNRQECGLPADGFVFCCFNGTWKIDPDVFALWMRLLTALPGSVLWLLDDVPETRDNLRREADCRGIDPARLAFAPLMPKADHLARLRHADLFLDTPLCNAHTTASDALWTGVPVLTCAGSTLATRVAASLLMAVGLPELIANDLESYERIALELARSSDALASLKQRLSRNRETQPLFDTSRFVRGLENAYQRIWLAVQRGERNVNIEVTEAIDGET
ncbi:MAG: tetratricopeptide repeat protein [Planctomycetes bacterium]|nr:tetratricopeptide repeat protein [Planctomycetota bacterium]